MHKITCRFLNVEQNDKFVKEHVPKLQWQCNKIQCKISRRRVIIKLPKIRVIGKSRMIKASDFFFKSTYACHSKMQYAPKC